MEQVELYPNDNIALTIKKMLSEENFKSFHYDFFIKNETKYVEVTYEDDNGFRNKFVEEWED